MQIERCLLGNHDIYGTLAVVIVDGEGVKPAINSSEREAWRRGEARGMGGGLDRGANLHYDKTR